MLTEADPKKIVNQGIAKKRLVLFDFDGTITTRDTLAEIMIHYSGKLTYRSGLIALSPIMLLYLLKLIPNWKAKQYMLSWFLKGEDATAFNDRCLAFTNKVLPGLIRPGALKMLNHYKSTGATIAVVTASAENWVKPWCDQNQFICLATKLEIKANKITGKIQGKNCHGPEKVFRINEKFSVGEFDEIIAYGDSAGDKEMLNLAHQQFYKPFRD